MRAEHSQTDDERPTIRILRQANTAAPNYGLQNADILATILDWQVRHGVRVVSAQEDSIELSLPDDQTDWSKLASDIYKFCPDVVDQSFGCFDEIYSQTPAGQLPLEVRALIAGIDFENDDFGLRILERALATRSSFTLWWD